MSGKYQGFTHTDLDGVMSNLLIRSMYMKLGYSVTCESCGYHNIDDKIISYLNSRDYDPSVVIVITDICPSYEVACKLDNLPNKKILIDHHQSSREDMCRKNGKDIDFKWMYIQEGDSATMYCYKYVLDMCSTFKDDNKLYLWFKKYKEVVYLTDLWDTKSRSCEEYRANLSRITLLNNLMSALGMNEFTSRFLINPEFVLSSVEYAKIEVAEKIKDKHCKGINVYRFVKELENGEKLLYGLCFSGNYRSEVASYQFGMDNNLGILFVIDMNSCGGSLRRSEFNKLGGCVDLTKIAVQFDENGGGHPFAAGFGFEIGDYNSIISKIVKGDFKVELEVIE